MLFQIICIPNPQKAIGNCEGVEEGSQKPKFLKQSIKLNCNFWRGREGRGFKPNNLLWGGMDTFSQVVTQEQYLKQSSFHDGTRASRVT